MEERNIYCEVEKCMNRNRRRATKKEKMDTFERFNVKKDKHIQQDAKRIPNLYPKTENQSLALDGLEEKQLNILSGNAGVGKTYISIWHACRRFLEGEVDRIIITRPNVTNGGNNPATPGTDFEKLQQMLVPMLENLSDFLGRERFSSMLGEDPLYSTITLAPLEKVAGRSFRGKTIVIADEFQYATVSQARSLVSRPENNCQMIILGDPRQAGKKGQNGLTYLVDTCKEYANLLEPYTSLVEFTAEDNVRSGLSGAMVKIFDEQGSVW